MRGDRIQFIEKNSRFIFAILLAIWGVFLVIGMKPTLAHAEEIPKTPQMLSVTQSGQGKVTVKWSGVERITGYRVFRKASGGSWESVYTTSNAAITSFVDTKLDAGKRYYYTVRAYRKNGSEVIWSGYDKYGLSIITEFQQIYPWKYTKEQLKIYRPSLKSLTEIGKNGLLLQWKLVSGMDGYRVYRREEGQSWKIVRTLMGGSSYYYLDMDTTVGVKYYYSVCGFKKLDGVYEWSSGQNPGLNAVAGVGAINRLEESVPEVNLMGKDTNAKIQWSRIEEADGYRIYRKEGTQSWKTVKTIMSGVTTEGIDKGLVSGKKYTYTIRAFILVNGTAKWSKYNAAGVSLIANQENISLNSPYLSLKKGGTYTLGLKGTKEKAKWSTNAEAIVRVNENGVVQAIAPGQAVITANLNGILYTTSVIVGDVNSTLNIITKYYTTNQCLARGETCNKIGIQVHSIGYATGSADNLYAFMNNPAYGAGVHYLVDAEIAGKVYQTMPENIRSWADAGFGNNNLISMEICESSYMEYIGNGPDFIVTDQMRFLENIKTGYDAAVQLCANICKKHGWDPTSKLYNGLYLISSHDEGRLAGVSSKHVDPTHIWSICGYSMDGFRADVKAAMKKM